MPERPQRRRDLRFHEFPERSTSFPMEREEVLLQLVLAGENAAADIAEARTAMEDFMVRSPAAQQLDRLVCQRALAWGGGVGLVFGRDDV